MTIVNVTKRDETAIQLHCVDSGVIMEIDEHYTFFVDGYKYMPLYKNKMWDGKARMFNRRNNTLPYGLLIHLAEFCKSRGYELKLDKSITNIVRPSLEELTRYVSSIPLSNRGKKIEMRDYQFDGFQQAIREGRSLLISPTGSGKSLIIYLMLRWYLDNHPDDKSVLIVVPTTSLVAQMKKDFADYSEFDVDFDAESEVHEIYSGKEKQIDSIEKFKIELDNGSLIILDGRDKIMLTTKKWKCVRDLLESDDICEKWLNVKINSSL